jgi:hypothetical protein
LNGVCGEPSKPEQLLMTFTLFHKSLSVEFAFYFLSTERPTSGADSYYLSASADHLISPFLPPFATAATETSLLEPPSATVTSSPPFRPEINDFQISPAYSHNFGPLFHSPFLPPPRSLILPPPRSIDGLVTVTIDPAIQPKVCVVRQ